MQTLQAGDQLTYCHTLQEGTQTFERSMENKLETDEELIAINH